MINTSVDTPVTEAMVAKYFKTLVNRIFKILPLKEQGEKTLPSYINSLQIEILGAKELINEFNDDPNFLTLVSILEYLKDNPDCEVADVKREVFRAISICNKMKDRYEKSV